MIREDGYTVYVHIAPNTKCYVGMTGQPPKRRWNNGNGYNSMSKFYSAIKQFGWENFQHIVLASDLTKDEAIQIELQMVQKYDSYNNGYNGSPDGAGYILSTQRCKDVARQSHQKSVHQYALNGSYMNSFISMSEASRKTGVGVGSISSCCLDKQASGGGYFWNFNKMNYYQSNRFCKERDILPVYQLSENAKTLVGTYKNIHEASKMSGVNYDCIVQAVLMRHGGNFAYGYFWTRDLNNFVPKRSTKNRPVQNITTGEIFENVHCAAERYGITNGAISYSINKGSLVKWKYKFKYVIEEREVISCV